MVKRHKLLYLIIVLTMIFSSSTISLANVSDIDGHWAKGDIVYLMEKNVMSGYSDGSFRPNNSITRAEFIKMVNNVYGFTEKADIQFADVKETHWFYDDIKKAVAVGYISGYEDGNMKPNAAITRQEAAKILALASGLDKEVSDNQINFRDKDKISQWAIEYVKFMVDKGYLSGYEDGTFRPERQITRGETAKLLTLISKDIFEDEEEPVIIPKYKEFILLIDELPEDWEITRIVAEEKVKVEKARNIYDNLKKEERDYIPREKIDKLERLEVKIESLKTPLNSKTKSKMRQAQAWAINKGAHKRFIDIADYYWAYGEITGINPEILYAQAAKETNFGRYTGQVRPEMNNWAGIKIYDPIGDNTYDHEIFPTPEDGVRAHFNHMGIYCGVRPIGDPHPRWYKTITASWAGKVKYVEDLGGKWAPNPDYGISIIRDYLNNLYATTTPLEEDINRALEFSDFVEELSEEDEEGIIDALIEYGRLTESQRALIPYNIKERLDKGTN